MIARDHHVQPSRLPPVDCVTVCAFVYTFGRPLRGVAWRDASAPLAAHAGRAHREGDRETERRWSAPRTSTCTRCQPQGRGGSDDDGILLAFSETNRAGLHIPTRKELLVGGIAARARAGGEPASHLQTPRPSGQSMQGPCKWGNSLKTTENLILESVLFMCL